MSDEIEVKDGSVLKGGEVIAQHVEGEDGHVVTSDTPISNAVKGQINSVLGDKASFEVAGAAPKENKNDPKPANNPQLGDLDPDMIEWNRRNLSAADFKAQYELRGIE